jgi:hypothetical protein
MSRFQCQVRLWSFWLRVRAHTAHAHARTRTHAHTRTCDERMPLAQRCSQTRVAAHPPPPPMRRVTCDALGQRPTNGRRRKTAGDAGGLRALHFCNPSASSLQNHSSRLADTDRDLLRCCGRRLCTAGIRRRRGSWLLHTRRGGAPGESGPLRGTTVAHVRSIDGEGAWFPQGGALADGRAPRRASPRPWRWAHGRVSALMEPLTLLWQVEELLGACSWISCQAWQISSTRCFRCRRTRVPVCPCARECARVLGARACMCACAPPPAAAQLLLGVLPLALQSLHVQLLHALPPGSWPVKGATPFALSCCQTYAAFGAPASSSARS